MEQQRIFGGNKMRNKIKYFLLSLLDLIYRKKCYFCKTSKYSLKMCPKCYETLTFSDFRANRIIDCVDIYSSGIYEKNLQKLIRGLKYHNQKELAYYLAKFMYEYFLNLEFDKSFQVVPTPLHPNRQKRRKYNHMELVAIEFCNISGCKYNPNLIKRVKDTKPQYSLSRTQRLENLNGAFVVDKTADLGMPVLLLDDICTTGTTFEEMIKILKQADINDITCLASSNP